MTFARASFAAARWLVSNQAGGWGWGGGQGGAGKSGSLHWVGRDWPPGRAVTRGGWLDDQWRARSSSSRKPLGNAEATGTTYSCHVARHSGAGTFAPARHAGEAAAAGGGTGRGGGAAVMVRHTTGIVIVVVIAARHNDGAGDDNGESKRGVA